MWMVLGRQPRYSEVEKPFSKISAGAYEGRFGSWRKALEAFVKWVNEERTEAEDAHTDSDTNVASLSEDSEAVIENKPKKSRRNPRNPSLRLRFRVMQHDNF